MEDVIGRVIVVHFKLYTVDHAVGLFVPSHNAVTQWCCLTPPYLTDASDILLQAPEVLKAVVLVVVVAAAVHITLAVRPTSVFCCLPVVALVLPPHSVAFRHVAFTICVKLTSSWKPPPWWISIETRQARTNFCPQHRTFCCGVDEDGPCWNVALMKRKW